MTSGNVTALKLRALTHVESVILTSRHSNAFVALSQLADGLHSHVPLDQASALVGFALENADLLNDVVAFGSDRHSNSSVIQQMSIDAKMLALGQILALTSLRMQSEDTNVTILTSPSGSVH